MVVLFSATFTVPAQPVSSSSASALSANFCFSKLFGTNACVAKCDVKVLSDSFKESFTEGFALLDGKTRQEMDMTQIENQMIPPAAMRQMGIDRQIIIMRPDLKVKYSIYPRLKSYVKKQLSLEDAAALDKEPTIEKMKLGTEEVEGHTCVKYKIVITTGDGQRLGALVWVAADLRNFPLRIQNSEDGTIELFTYKQIQFIKPDATQFEPPAGFTAYDNFSEMMEKTQTNGVTDLTGTNAANIMDERLALVVDFTLRKGTNRPISSATAKAFGLGDEKIPVIQIVLARKGEAAFQVFGVSAQNSNDLFVARIDRNTRRGIVWLTSRTGKIRATILTSTNGPPTVVPNDLHASEFKAKINAFLEFMTRPLGEGVLHPLNVAARFGTTRPRHGFAGSFPIDGKVA